MSVEEQIFWFQVSVYNIARVEVFESQGDFGSVEFGNRIGEALE